MKSVRYCIGFEIPSKKQLKPNAIPTTLPKPNGGNSQQTTPSQRPASERRKRKAVSTSYKNLMIKQSILKAMFNII